MPWRTIVDNTIVGLEVAGTPRDVARARARELFPRFGLEGFERRYPAELSGGMRQRAALLRTFLAGRDVNLLDEPFGALDSLTRAGMQQWLLGVWEGHRKTILFVTHDVDEALFLSDRVYVMSPRPGRVARVLEVELPRPRSYDVVTSDGFTAMKRLLVEQLNLAHGAEASGVSPAGTSRWRRAGRSRRRSPSAWSWSSPGRSARPVSGVSALLLPVARRRPPVAGGQGATCSPRTRW